MSISPIALAALLAEYGIEEALDGPESFSDDFASALYMAAAETMVITFMKGSGRQYEMRMSQDDWERFRDSGDRGLYWNRNLRGKV